MGAENTAFGAMKDTKDKSNLMLYVIDILHY